MVYVEVRFVCHALALPLDSDELLLFLSCDFDLTVSRKSALATLSESGTSSDFASFPA